tara:strand:- start:20 stop:283 length:264 start_codon:yes stop_codon:yes gene_type:complete
MSHEHQNEQKVNHYSRVQARHKNRGIRYMGTHGTRRIELEVVWKWDEMIEESARQKGKTHWKANGIKWKHATSRKMRHKNKMENVIY